MAPVLNISISSGSSYIRGSAAPVNVLTKHCKLQCWHYYSLELDHPKKQKQKQKE
jgi:hypothetical protein